MADEIIPPEKTPASTSQSIGAMGALMSAIGICLLTLSFLGSFLFATIWAFSYLIGMPAWMTYPFYALAALATAWATLWATGRAWHVEKRIESGQDIDTPVFGMLHYFRSRGSAGTQG